MEREGVPKGRGIVTEGVKKVFHRFVNSAIEGGGLKELEFRGTSPCVSGRRVRGGLILVGKLVGPG